MGCHAVIFVKNHINKKQGHIIQAKVITQQDLDVKAKHFAL